MFMCVCVHPVKNLGNFLNLQCKVSGLKNFVKGLGSGNPGKVVEKWTLRWKGVAWRSE